MKLSIFTPSHCPKFLGDAYNSLLRQEYPDWEWVIVLNVVAAPEDLQPSLVSDPKVRVITYPSSYPIHIGGLKRFGCEQASGDIFIELDHDDMFFPDGLATIARAFQNGADFVYSDTCIFCMVDGDMKSFPYAAHLGWDSYPYQALGRTMKVSRCFELNARSMCEIYWSPDHVRAWTREAYWRAGGHDASLFIGDDHDVVCRTYLTHARFAITDKPCYLYRCDDDSTLHHHGDAISRQQTINRDRYMDPLLEEWLRREQLDMLRLDGNGAGGHDSSLPRIDADDNSLACIRVSSNLAAAVRDSIVPFLNEAYRALIPGGWLCIEAPDDGEDAIVDLPAKFAWTLDSPENFCRQELAEKIPGYDAKFQCVRSIEETRDEKPGLRVDLSALKGQRQPGRVYF